MDWTSLIGPAVVAAVISSLVAVIGFWFNARTARAIHAEKLAFDRDQASQKLAFDERLADRKFEFDKDLAERKAAADIALANRKFTLDAKLADRKRRQDLAEEVLESFYKIRDVIRAVRVPMSFQDEAASRPHAEYEPPEVAQQRNTYYAPLARLDTRRADIAALLAKRYRAAAWFGAAAEGPFQDVHEALTDIARSAETLMANAGSSQGGTDREFWKELEGNIWARRQNPDPIATKVDAAIAKIETIFRPALEEQSA